MCTYNSELEKGDLTFPCSLTARGAVTSESCHYLPIPRECGPGLLALDLPAVSEVAQQPPSRLCQLLQP